MSTFPEATPNEPADSITGNDIAPPSVDPLAPANTPEPPAEWAAEPGELTAPMADASSTSFISPPPAGDLFSRPIFSAPAQPPIPREERIPHLGHLGLLALLVLFGTIGSGIVLFIALRIHLFGVTKAAQATTDFRYALGSQAIQYLLTFVGCLVVFPLVWRKSFFEGLHWHSSLALQRVGRLISVAVFCFFVAMINGMLMPGPTDAPIDQLFRAPGAAWALFAFGCTLAPFFEEMAFRGFILPSLCTAYDWTVEHITGAPRRPLDENDSPQWSLTAMIVASLLTSVPFALMHGAQTSWSLGPFLLLIFVSLILCWVRLSTKSLAASTIVHACYNFMLFSFMLLGTGGFKHLDKM